MTSDSNLYHSKSLTSLANVVKDDRPSGNKRSIIRRIGSNLPLSSTQRPLFEILPSGARLIHDSTALKPSLLSLSDICQISEIPDIFFSSEPSSNPFNSGVKAPVKEDTTDAPSEKSSEKPPSEEMVSKISALEDELSQLRSQIAMLVSNQAKFDTSIVSGMTEGDVSGTSNLTTTSTPVKLPPPLGAPPPPPPPLPMGIPPPPPPPPPMMTPSKSASDVKELIRKRKMAKGKDCVNAEIEKSEESKPRPISMSDVLKDLHKVKLKSVERSPGGTPMGKNKHGSGRGENRKSQLADREPTDPAALIAAALRKKFSHRSHRHRSESSPDRNNTSANKLRDDKEWGDSPPRFGQHMLKKRNKDSPLATS